MGNLHRRNVITVGNDHQTSTSAFIHLPPGDTWDQPDYTFIFRGFSVCFFVQCRVIKTYEEKQATQQNCCDIIIFIMQKKLVFLEKETWLRKLLYIKYII